MSRSIRSSIGGQFMRIVVVARRVLGLGFAASLVLASQGCLGCGGDPAGVAESSEAVPGVTLADSAETGALRVDFPDHAARVLDAIDGFVAEGDRFHTERAAPLASRHGLAISLPLRASDAIHFEAGGF